MENCRKDFQRTPNIGQGRWKNAEKISDDLRRFVLRKFSKYRFKERDLGVRGFEAFGQKRPKNPKAPNPQTPSFESIFGLNK
jgi:hypothetical protein